MQKYIILTDERTKVRMPTPPYYFLPVEGAWQDWNGSSGRFWRRRVKDEDVKALDKKPKKIVIKETTITSSETTIKRKGEK